VLRTYAAKHKIELALLRFTGVYGYYSVAGGPGVAVQQAVWDALAGKLVVLNVYDRRFYLREGFSERHCARGTHFAFAA
jgi:hypothetical protein